MFDKIADLPDVFVVHCSPYLSITVLTLNSCTYALHDDILKADREKWSELFDKIVDLPEISMSDLRIAKQLLNEAIAKNFKKQEPTTTTNDNAICRDHRVMTVKH